MKLFDYSIKIKVILIGILVILIAASIFLITYNNSHSRDLETMVQVRSLATGLEYYFDKKHAYPLVEKTDLVNIKVITENGVNQPGDYFYFVTSDQAINGTLVSTADKYAIDFELENSWNLWGLNTGGGICRISNYLAIICKSR